MQLLPSVVGEVLWSGCAGGAAAADGSALFSPPHVPLGESGRVCEIVVVGVATAGSGGSDTRGGVPGLGVVRVG